MIIWLASYPKSGNTWVRSIISSLLYTNDGIFNLKLLRQIDQFPEKKYFKDLINDFGNFNQIKSHWILAQDKINLDGKKKLFKTHQGKYTIEGDNFVNSENTSGVIYVVRDPRTVVSSISNHYTKSINDSLKFMLSPSMIGNAKSFEEKKSGLLTLLGKWNEHYRSWTKVKKNLLLIKYEDLLLKPDLELEKITSFLKKYFQFETNEKKNRNILDTTSFQNLKKMENKYSFNEAVLNKETNSKVNFFNLGPKNNWRNLLNREVIKSIEENFASEMKELDYL